MARLQTAYVAADAVIRPAVFDAARRLGWDLKPTPTTAGLPFVDSPTGLVLCLAAYFTIVLLGLALQPRRERSPAAKPEDPLWLRLLVLGHNVFLVTLSMYMSLEVGRCAIASGYKLWGVQYSPRETAMARVIHIFFVSKIYEFMDTFIMLLKGNVQQVTVLHVYHHATISFIWWMITYTAPGGDAYFSAALNSFVHVLMYTYYLMAILLGKDPKVRARYLWWGRYLTQFQMLQFLANLVQAAYCWRYSPYPRFLSKVLFWYMISLLFLFGSFYYSKHIKGAKGKSTDSKKRQ